MIAAALTGRGHAGLLALDCSPAEGGVLAGRLIVAEDLSAGAYAGFEIEKDKTRISVTVCVPALESGIYVDMFLEVRHES